MIQIYYTTNHVTSDLVQISEQDLEGGGGEREKERKKEGKKERKKEREKKRN